MYNFFFMKFRSLSATRAIMKIDTKLSLPLLITMQSQVPPLSLTILLLKKTALASYSWNGTTWFVCTLCGTDERMCRCGFRTWCTLNAIYLSSITLDRVVHTEGSSVRLLRLCFTFMRCPPPAQRLEHKRHLPQMNILSTMMQITLLIIAGIHLFCVVYSAVSVTNCLIAHGINFTEVSIIY